MPDPAHSVRGHPLPAGTSLDRLPPEQVELVLAHARLLQAAAHPEQRQRLLRGRNLALICESASDPDAVAFREAAMDLGAHVSHLRPALADLRTPSLRQHTARMLARLYQGIECQGVPHDLVDELGRDAGIPVYDGIASPEHPVARLATLLDGAEPIEQRRRLILQAVLMSTLA